MNAEQEMTAQQQIISTTIAMAVLADRREWDALTTIFTNEVRSDYTALTGGEPSTVRASDLVAGWKEGLSAFTATQHLVTNHEVVITGDHAEVRAYFQATHCKPDQTLWILGGRYHYTVEKQADRWRISAITMTPLWARDERNTYGK
jgi:ketosteroid isomerase-like protein